MSDDGPERIRLDGRTADAPVSAEVMLMLLADARLPTGAHTQSGGLEPALQQGLSARDVPKYIDTRLRTVTTVEAATAVVARHAVGRVRPDELPETLAAIDEAWRARTISNAMRASSEILGRGYLRLMRRLWPDAIPVGALGRMTAPSRAVAIGVCAAVVGLTAPQLVRLVGYDDAQTVAAAALKLEPLDPAVSTAWVLGARLRIERMVTELSRLTKISEIPAHAAPMIERWAEIHATTNQRLFRA